MKEELLQAAKIEEEKKALDGSLSIKELEKLLIEKTEALEECMETIEQLQCDGEEMR